MINNKFFYGILTLVVFLLVSCQDKDQIVSNQEVIEKDNMFSNLGFNFSKDLSVNDEQGNSVSIKVFTLEESKLDELSEESFEFLVFTEEVDQQAQEVNNPKIPMTENNPSQGVMEDGENLLILINDTKLKPGITSFSISPKQKNAAHRDTDWRELYAYEETPYVKFIYYAETCSAEYLFCHLWEWNYFGMDWEFAGGTIVWSPGNSGRVYTSVSDERVYYIAKYKFINNCANSGFSARVHWRPS